MSDFANFPCVPPCIECRQAGLCNQPVDCFDAGETVTAPRPFSYAYLTESFRMPCGCDGLVWSIIQTFGSDIADVFCSKHGWLKISKHWKENKKKEEERRRRKAVEEVERVKRSGLFEIPPF